MLPTKFRIQLIAASLIVVMLVPLPVLVAGVNVNNTTESPIIAPSLAEMIDQQGANEFIPVVFKFPQGTPPEIMEDQIAYYNSNDIIIKHSFHIVPMVSAYATGRAVERLASSGVLTSVVQDRKIEAINIVEPNEYKATSFSGYRHPDEIIDVDQLWASGINGTGITVAVLDSGAWGQHPDLVNKIIGFKDLINGRDDLDPSNGMNAYDDNGHGTGTAWLVAGTDAGTGSYSGMAPGADLLIVKILDEDGTTDDSTIAQGIEYAVDAGADVISLSVGGPWSESYLFDPSISACEAAVESGVTVVVAAGNSGPASGTINSPGVTQEVITVGASNGDYGVATFSSRGPVTRDSSTPRGRVAKPDVIAPGYHVMSGRWVDANPYDYPIYNSTQFGDYYMIWSGTSAATPIVAGAAALLKQKYAGLSPLAVKAFLMAGAKDLGFDPMAQGMGLVNVTRASELITGTSRVITLMSPLRYPTLPEGDKVLVIGDNRPPQNITVISTVNHYGVEIVVKGNASVLVNISSATMDVKTGYSYFSVGLDVPDNLPLSEIGLYTGNISLVNGDETYATMSLRLVVTTFGGRILVDMMHQAINDNDDPDYYSYFGQELRTEGILTERLEGTLFSNGFTLDMLSSSEIFLIMDTETPYTQEEIDAIHKYVEDGGVLLILSEYYDSVTNNASFNIDSYNKILEPYGIQCEKNGIGVGVNGNGLVYGVNSGGSAEDDPLVEGVDNLYVVYGGTLSVDPTVANARGLLWIDSEKQHALIATAQSGKGKVIAISDGSTLYDDIINDATDRGADNLQLIHNLAKSIVSDTPRIYGVDFEAGGVGSTANLTVYVFDENLESVSVTVTKPDDTNATTTLSETLGYRFTTSFVIETGGFYTIHVEATDADGNIRIYEKTILIPIKAAEDQFITAVIGGLLIIVVIGLCYVASLKFSGGRRPRRSQPEEWEVPVNDGTPPEIV